MDIDWTLDLVAGVALVAVCLTADAPVPQRARVENRLDGPLLAPRRRGVPESGWDDDGVELTLTPGESAALGYACPVPDAGDGSPPTDPPVELSVTPVAALPSASQCPDDAAEGDPVRDALHRLGVARPPRAAIPTDRPWKGARGPSEAATPGHSHDAGRDTVRESGRAPFEEGAHCSLGDADLPAGIASWFATVGERIDLAERFDGASVGMATEALDVVGGVDGAERVQTRVEADAEALRAVAARAETLANRAESVTVPVEALRGLA